MRPHHLPGLLLAIEGIDGAGKTTQVELLRARLARWGRPITVSKEPTDGPYGRRIRATAQTGRLPAAEELALFLADRREHVTGLVLPALDAGHIVILDRYYYSTAAYQGARGLAWADILAENEAFAPEPDLVALLDIDPAVSLARIGERGDDPNHFEHAAALAQSREIFHQLAAARSCVCRFDSSAPAAALAEQIDQELACRFCERVALNPTLTAPQRLTLITEFLAQRGGGLAHAAI